MKERKSECRNEEVRCLVCQETKNRSSLLCAAAGTFSQHCCNQNYDVENTAGAGISSQHGRYSACRIEILPVLERGLTFRVPEIHASHIQEILPLLSRNVSTHIPAGRLPRQCHIREFQGLLPPGLFCGLFGLYSGEILSSLFEQQLKYPFRLQLDEWWPISHRGRRLRPILHHEVWKVIDLESGESAAVRGHSFCRTLTILQFEFPAPSVPRLDC